MSRTPVIRPNAVSSSNSVSYDLGRFQSSLPAWGGTKQSAKPTTMAGQKRKDYPIIGPDTRGRSRVGT
jgi:hypothetical protein